ncbi:hypothetical protein DIPPA_03037 [Diplonema papillatum]|nr:hypothetical protein DIPPA_03037 [Diplonema papillatum]
MPCPSRFAAISAMVLLAAEGVLGTPPLPSSSGLGAVESSSSRSADEGLRSWWFGAESLPGDDGQAGAAAGKEEANTTAGADAGGDAGGGGRYDDGGMPMLIVVAITMTGLLSCAMTLLVALLADRPAAPAPAFVGRSILFEEMEPSQSA